MNILEIRMWFATEYGLVLTIIGILLTIMSFANVINRHKLLCICICFFSSVTIVLIVFNMIDFQKNYVDIPKVENIDTENAKMMLAQAGVDINNVFVIGDQGTPISENNSKVVKQSECGICKKTNNSLIVELMCVPYDTYTPNSDSNDPSSSTKNEIVFSTPQSSTASNDLSIIIKDYEFFENGFYYEMPIDENSFSFVYYKNGISGTFEYSRELTSQEYENWGHGGKILNKDGIECIIDASFFSTSDGIFAIELPEDMPKGDYIYVLYQSINGEYCEAFLPFTVN